MLKNKKGTTPITVFFLILGFVAVWALALAPILNDQGKSAVQSGDVTGFGAFMLANINLLIFFLMIIFILAYQVWGSSG